jgi:glycosyltransferase involved in cell wall biosynthesis
VPDGIPPEKVFTSDRLLFAGAARRLVPADLAPVYRKWGARGANVVYSMYGEEPSFLEWMKARGAKIVIDVFVHPSTMRIIATEAAERLGTGFDEAAVQADEAHSRRLFDLADALFCPSQWVAEGVREFLPNYQGQVCVVPYGSSIEIAARPNLSPVRGRVLFAGRDPLRKGLHHLAEAAHLLRLAGQPIEVHVAGIEQREIGWMDHRGELDCLGTIPMRGMREEFSRADLTVLPSLSEGQAGVVLEAMACGCPVVATRESGVDFEPGCGIVVPVRDARALADAIARVVGDRDLRNELAHGALRQSRQFSTQAWQQRLVAALGNVVRQ